MTPRVKICCIGSVEEAQLAIRHGAAALGLVSKTPGGPGAISDSLIAEIADSVPPPVATFLLTSLQSVEAIVAQQRRCRTNTVQLCDRLLHGSYAELRLALPGIGLVQLVQMTDEASISEALGVAIHVDALLLDSGNPAPAVKGVAGTGSTHNWRMSQRIAARSLKPVFLAGGLREENVAQAIGEVAPFGLDVSTGVRTAGRLDEAKLRGFFAAVTADLAAEARRL
jgi:phosphoribosylanthranilate isomerase